MGMVIGYARVSTEGQDLSLQLEALEKYGCVKIFKEKCSTRGYLQERDNAISILSEGDSFVVWKLDRLSRSLSDLLQVISELSQREVKFISLQDNIDTSTASGKFQLAVFGAMAEFEREIIRERTLAGLEIAKAKGVQLGRPRGMSQETLERCKAVDILVQRGGKTVSEACRVSGVSRMTYYKYRG